MNLPALGSDTIKYSKIFLWVVFSVALLMTFVSWGEVGAKASLSYLIFCILALPFSYSWLDKVMSRNGYVYLAAACLTTALSLNFFSTETSSYNSLPAPTPEVQLSDDDMRALVLMKAACEMAKVPSDPYYSECREKGL